MMVLFVRGSASVFQRRRKSNFEQALSSRDSLGGSVSKALKTMLPWMLAAMLKHGWDVLWGAV